MPILMSYVFLSKLIICQNIVNILTLYDDVFMFQRLIDADRMFEVDRIPYFKPRPRARLRKKISIDTRF
jgi:hypothetical protein